MLIAQKKRIYKSYHACPKAAHTQLMNERFPAYCCSNHYSDEDAHIPREDIRQLALKMTAERYHVTTSEVSLIARELRIPDVKSKSPYGVVAKAKKRIHKR